MSNTKKESKPLDTDASGTRIRRTRGKGGATAKRGAPLKFSKEVSDKIITLVQNGNYIETASAAVGIHKDTLYNWLRKGASGEQPYADFSDSLQKAVGLAESMDLARIGAASASGAWTASAWRLERRHPERWARRDFVGVNEFSGASPEKQDAPEDILDLDRESTEILARNLELFFPNQKVDSIMGKKGK